MSPRVTVAALAALGLAMALASTASAQPAAAQAVPAPAQAPGQPPAAEELPTVTVCGQQARPAAQPPPGSGPVVLFIAPCFEAQGNQSVVEAPTYLYYIQLKFSAPSRGFCLQDDATTEKMIVDDFHRLWNTNFLDNLWI